MDVPNQLPQVRVFLAEDGFVAVLKKWAMPAQPPVVGRRVPGQESLHKGSKGDSTRLEDEMDMIRHECPRKAGRAGLKEEQTQTVNEGLAVRFVPKDPLSFDPANHEVMEATREVYPRMPWHLLP
jgi:hypothetical protein